MFDAPTGAQLDGYADRDRTLRVVVRILPRHRRRSDAAALQRRCSTTLIARDSDHVLYRALVLHADGAGVHRPSRRRAPWCYDCMDELSAFAGAPPRAARARSASCLHRADVVFTGGQSLYEAKRHRHPNVHAFPSSVDVAHFAQRAAPIRRACRSGGDPASAARILRRHRRADGPRARSAAVGALPGPTGIRASSARSSRSIPRRCRARANIHYLGPKSYDELPAYLAGWDVALLPFARNDATRFISPTKTPEYLAAGKPVVSTSIRDVVRPYGDAGLARIADDARRVRRGRRSGAGEDAAAPPARTADAFLTHMSWDATWDTHVPTGGGVTAIERAARLATHSRRASADAASCATAAFRQA